MDQTRFPLLPDPDDEASLRELGESLLRLRQTPPPGLLDRVVEASASRLPGRASLPMHAAAPAMAGSRLLVRRIGSGLAMAAAMGLALVLAFPFANSVQPPRPGEVAAGDPDRSAPVGIAMASALERASRAEPVLVSLLQGEAAGLLGEPVWDVSELIPSQGGVESAVKPVLEVRSAEFHDLAAEMAAIRGATARR